MCLWVCCVDDPQTTCCGMGTPCMHSTRVSGKTQQKRFHSNNSWTSVFEYWIGSLQLLFSFQINTQESRDSRQFKLWDSSVLVSSGSGQGIQPSQPLRKLLEELWALSAAWTLECTGQTQKHVRNLYIKRLCLCMLVRCKMLPTKHKVTMSAKKYMYMYALTNGYKCLA